MKKTRIVYIDFLKIIALVMVMCIHIVSPMWWNNNIHSDSFWIANFFEGISRFAVPVFVMCTGSFLLDPGMNLETKKLMKKTFQMLIALIVFGLMYSISFDLIEGQMFSLKMIMDGFYNIYTVNAANHLWFIYMLIGLYLVTPILRSYIKGASKTNIEYFLLLWAIFGLLLNVIVYLPTFRSLRPLVEELKITLVMAYPGYAILGYYLKTYEINFKLRIAAYIAGIIGLYLTVFNTYERILDIDKLSQVYFKYTSITVAVTALAIFIFAKYNLNVQEQKAKIVSNIASYTFGIFLVHGIFVYIMPKLYNFKTLYDNLWITPFVAIFIYSITFIIVYLLCKIPGLNKILK